MNPAIKSIFGFLLLLGGATLISCEQKDSENLGVESAKSPKAPEDSEKIAVDHLEPELIEFEGFINYGTPIEVQAVNDLGLPEGIVITDSRIEMPVFTARSNKSKRAESGRNGD